MSIAGGSARAMSEQLRQQAIAKRVEAAQLDEDADAWAAGADGEDRVAQALKAVESSSCRVLHDRLLKPGKSRTNLDHLVVSPAGIYLIDAKNWAGDVTVYEGGLWQHRTVGGERVHLPKKLELDKVSRYAEEMAASGAGKVEPVICLAGDRSAQSVKPRSYAVCGSCRTAGSRRGCWHARSSRCRSRRPPWRCSCRLAIPPPPSPLRGPSSGPARTPHPKPARSADRPVRGALAAAADRASARSSSLPWQGFWP